MALRTGDIFATKATGWMGWLCSRLFSPKSDRLHFGILGDGVASENDWVILESIGKGIAVGRLSMYAGQHLKFYRPTNLVAQIKGGEAALVLSKYGRARYDYMLIVKLVVDVVRLVFTGHLPPWRPEDFKYSRNSNFICTEAAACAWRDVGYPIIPEGVLPMPASFQGALNNGVIFEVDKY